MIHVRYLVFLMIAPVAVALACWPLIATITM